MKEPGLKGLSFRKVDAQGTQLRVATGGSGPLVLLIHGWPELWYAWRHQLTALMQAGFRVAAPDLRGYGGSDKPHEVDAYTIKALVGDVLSVMDSLDEERAFLIGHDWGAPICWNTAALHPERVRAVAGLSVPFSPRPERPPLETYQRLFAASFFYQTYFLDEGEAEAELEADVRVSLRKVLYLFSGNVPYEALVAFSRKKAFHKFLDGVPDPDPLPDWFSEQDLDVYAEAFEQGGFRGPLNRYRCQDLDWHQLPQLEGARIAPPSLFIAGEQDAIRWMIPGEDAYEDPGASCDDFRGSHLLSGMGHWVQQEAPLEVNNALLAFLRDCQS